MDVKSFIKIGLFSVGIPAMNIGSAFAWECSLGHEHAQDEMCTETGDRPCNACEKGFHRGWELCPQTVFEIPSEKCKLICVSSNVQDGVVAALLTGCKYDQASGKEIEYTDLSYSEKDVDEVRRLGCYVQRLKNKYLLKKAKGKKEGKFLGKKRNAPEAEAKGKKGGDGEEGEFLNKEGNAPEEAVVEDKKEGDESAEGIGDDNKKCKVLFIKSEKQKKLEAKKRDRRIIGFMELGEDIELKQGKSEWEKKMEIIKKCKEMKEKNEKKGEGAIKQEGLKKKK